jgi:hypothetical protein
VVKIKGFFCKIKIPSISDRHPGSRTPTSVARKVLESVTKRRNKEKNRARQHLEALQQQQQQQQQLQQLLGNKETNLAHRHL